MAFHSLQFIPGLNAQFTPTLNRTGWVGELIGGVPTTNLIRWPADSQGLPEVVGGWAPFLVGAGSSLTNPFTTTSGSSTVLVLDAGHAIGLTPGEIVIFTSTASVGGLTITGSYVIQSVGGSYYTITASSNATSSATGGGTVAASYASSFLVGICRGLHSWATLLGLPTVSAGTNSHLYIIQGGVPSDITPVSHTSSGLTNPFTTTNASATVLVTDAGYAPNIGDYIEISGASAVHGITLAGEYVVLTTPSGTTYTIQAAIAATGSGAGGGTPTLNYLLGTGAIDEGPGLGWGIGGWGLGTWGTARVQSTVTASPGIWQMDNWGEDLIAVRGPWHRLCMGYRPQHVHANLAARCYASRGFVTRRRAGWQWPDR